MLAIALVIAAVTLGNGTERRHAPAHRASPPHTATQAAVTQTQAAVRTTTTPSTPKPKPPTAKPPFGVGTTTIRLVDRTRHVRLPGRGTEPRTLVTYVRYPQGRRGEQVAGRFPLIVFGHGYTLNPTPYARLLDAWTRAGYVVAAPVFPLENADAPGGPDESDLVNQPRDMSFVISRMLAASARPAGPLSNLIDPNRVAVAGHSDGGETALAVAYDRYYQDSRVGAAVILSGAKIPGVGGFNFPPGSPPLLATQGTSDTINPPSFTSDFYNAAQRPKYLLQLLGAPHLEPYTTAQPQLGIVERVTTAFLDLYMKRDRAAGARLASLGAVHGVAALTAER
jgi:fermentation-respiration switch protein FrsA (DUF1100 family)